MVAETFVTLLFRKHLSHLFKTSGMVASEEKTPRRTILHPTDLFEPSTPS